MTPFVFLDGKKPDSIDLVITYVCIIVAAIGLIWFSRVQNIQWSTLQYITVFLLTAELVGGVISKLTQSINSFYQNSKTFSANFIAI